MVANVRCLMRWDEIYWTAWLVLIFGTSLPVIAFNRIRRRPWRNLVETLWRWTENDPAHLLSFKRFPWPLIPLTVFWSWLTIHLVFGFLG